MPPSPPTPLPCSTQWSSDPDDDDKLYSQMSSEELGKETHKIVMSLFGFARFLARTMNEGTDVKELEKYNPRIDPRIGILFFLKKNQQRKFYL